MARQPSLEMRARNLAAVLHDLAWLLPRTLDPEVEAELDHLPQSELEVMRLLVRRPGLSVGAVAHELGLQTSNASAAIRSLMARGLLERRRDSDDRRVTRLEPTVRAGEMRRRREQAWGRALRHRLEQLDGPEMERLLDATASLRRLTDMLSSGGERERPV